MGLFVGLGIGVVAAFTAPLWGSLYIQGLGKLANRKVLGESGTVMSIKPHLAIKSAYTPFEVTLSQSGAAIWLFLLGMDPAYLPMPFYATYTFVRHMREH